MKIKLSLASSILCFLLWNCQSRQSPPEHYILDESQSVVVWKGYLKNGDANNGTVGVRGDKIAVEDGEIQNGSFSLPLSTLISLNLPTDDLKHQLVHHLQSVDFFDMAAHPEIKFDMTGIKKYSGGAADDVPQANYMVAGGLTILGKTHPIFFPASISITEEKLTVEGRLTINRNEWGMTYASDESAPDGMYIKPGIDLHVKVSARKNQNI